MVQGEKQLAILKKLIACDPYYMELSSFRAAYVHAWAQWEDSLDRDNHETRCWVSLSEAINSIAIIRFGFEVWKQVRDETETQGE